MQRREFEKITIMQFTSLDCISKLPILEQYYYTRDEVNDRQDKCNDTMIHSRSNNEIRNSSAMDGGED